ncbi:hypothetical protein WEI85_35895 [Actinomycetes bacterium KLBMP 9797]
MSLTDWRASASVSDMMQSFLAAGMNGLYDAIYDAIEERVANPFGEPCPEIHEWISGAEHIYGWASQVHYFNCQIVWNTVDDYLKIFGLIVEGQTNY